MNNGQMDRGNENPTQHLPWWLMKTTKKPVRLVGTGNRTRDLPNAESRALPWSHLSHIMIVLLAFIEDNWILTLD